MDPLANHAAAKGAVKSVAFEIFKPEILTSVDYI